VWDAGGRFSRRPRAEREAALRRWRDSAIPARRRVYHGLRRGTLIPYHARAKPPTTAAVAEPRLKTFRVSGDTRFSCDVCVVGSGAGGGVAAAVLAEAGLDVVVLEAGGHYEDADFGGVELDAYRHLYYESAAPTTSDGGVGLLAGSCIGGTTVVNYTTSFRTPDAIREEWGDPFMSSDYGESLDAVGERIGVNTDEGSPSSRDEVMARVAGIGGRDVLEVGCGEGMMFDGTGLQPVQMDVSMTRVGRAAGKSRFLLCADGYQLPFADESFEVVLLIAVLEHTREPGRLLAEARRVLKRGGRAIVVVPNDATMSAGRLLLGKFPIRYPDHLTFTTPARMRLWLANGFRVRERFMLPFRWLPFAANLYYFVVAERI